MARGQRREVKNRVDAIENGTPIPLYEVVGVKNGDVLKLRAGPGTDYRILLGLPNGTVLRLTANRSAATNGAKCR